MRKRARIIYNPTSGKELSKRELPDTLIKLEKAEYETSAYVTEEIGDAAFETERVMHENYDALIAVDGDGTLNEAVNGIAEKSNRPKLGVTPMGTVNDSGRALHTPSNIMGALDIIIEGHSTKVDIGKVNSRYFINLAAGGQLTQVPYEAPSKSKSAVGPFAYCIKGSEMSPQMKVIDLGIEYGGNAFQGETLLFFLGLTNSMVGLEKLAPDAELDDGYFMLAIVEKSNLAGLGHIMTLASRGEYTKHPKVTYEKAGVISISLFIDLQLNIGGEYGGKLSANFSNPERHIDVFAPDDIVNKELINNDHVNDNLIGE